MIKLTAAETAEVEAELGLELPSLYRELLLETGYGRLDTGSEIYHPAAVWELYEPFFDDPEQLFNPYFPFGCQNLKQELWVIDASTGRAASIWHETVPDDWPEEEWLPYDVWIEEHLRPELPVAD